MRDRSIDKFLDANPDYVFGDERGALEPRTAQQECQAQLDEELREDIREELRSLHIQMGVEDAITEKRFDELVEETFQERKEPPGGGATLDWCNPWLGTRGAWRS